MNGLYAAASALDAQRLRQEVAANNLANLETPGFKRGMVAQRGFERELGLVEARGALDLRQGDLVATGGPLDVALDGPGFLCVGTPDGERYVRGGHLQRSADGQLVTADGAPLQGEGGPISLGAGASVAIADDGRVVVDGAEVGRLRVVTFEGAPPEAEGSGRYRAGSPPAPAPGTRVRGGHLERGNASSIDELVGLITIQRSFEAASRAIDTTLRAVERATTDLR